MQTVVAPSGRLTDRFSPAVYFDSSVLIDYWMAEGLESPGETTEIERDWAVSTDHPLGQVVRDLVRANTRLSKVAELRRKVILGETRAWPVTSHAALWELQEWLAESAIKQAGAEVLGMVFWQRKSKKEIGDHLKKAFELWQDEGDEQHHDSETGTSSLEALMQETWLNLSYARAHGLQGISIAETVGFSWPPKQGDGEHSFADPYTLAYLQLGLADIMHVLMANHFGCRYFASFDSDFRRAREFIEGSGMLVLASPEEVLSVL